jgi:hypothetical protein
MSLWFLRDDSLSTHPKICLSHSTDLNLMDFQSWWCVTWKQSCNSNFPIILSIMTPSSAYRCCMMSMASVRNFEEACAHKHSTLCWHANETMWPSKSRSNSHSIQLMVCLTTDALNHSVIAESLNEPVLVGAMVCSKFARWYNTSHRTCCYYLL